LWVLNRGLAQIMSSLYRLIYCSRSTLTGSPPELEAEVRRILATARENNRAAGVTGAMAFNDDWFAQVLEGSKSDVVRIFGKISRDPRHCDLGILQQTAAATRLFPTWSMAYAETLDHQGRHPLAHFQFEPALNNGAQPEAQKLLAVLRRTVVELANR
jgi:hypothetical protein